MSEQTTNIINAITKEKLSLVKKNLSEISLIVLALCVAFLFKLYIDLSNDFKNYLVVDRKELIEVLKDVNESMKTRN